MQSYEKVLREYAHGDESKKADAAAIAGRLADLDSLALKITREGALVAIRSPAFGDIVYRQSTLEAALAGVPAVLAWRMGRDLLDLDAIDPLAVANGSPEATPLA